MDERFGADPTGKPTPRQTTLGQLRIRPDFLRVAATRRRHATPGLVLQVAEMPGDPTTDPKTDHGQIRVGYTATRKVGGAVVRNRARRRLREVAKRLLPAHAKTGRDYVVIARRDTAARPFDKLIADMETALRRLDSWRNDTPPDSGKISV